MIKVVTCTEKHLDEVEDLLPVFQSEKPFLYRLKLILHRKDSVSHAFMVGDKVIGCFGCVLIGGVAEVWAWFGAGVKKYPIEFSKRCLFAIDYYMKRLKIKRVEMYFKVEGDLLGWGKFLGFRKVAIVEGLDGCQYFRMVRGG